MEDLQLWWNMLSGAIPSELGKCSILFYLFLASNQLTGYIPTELGALESMRDLELEYNYLSGPIPSELGSYLDLEYLWLHDNLLTNIIPSEIGNLVRVQDINLASNQLSGELPGVLSVLLTDYNISAFNISSNPLLEGQVHEDLCDMRFLSFDCSVRLCGCDCPCFETGTNGTTFVIIDPSQTDDYILTQNVTLAEFDGSDL